MSTVADQVSIASESSASDDSSQISASKGNGSLHDHITDMISLPLESSIPALRNLLDTGLESSLTYTGIRAVTHPFYSGSYSLNSLARAWMAQARKLRESSSPLLSLRLLQHSLLPKFQRLYAASKQAVKDSKFVWFFAMFRDFRIGCGCCSGDPLICIPYDERCDEALFFKPEVWKECFGDSSLRCGVMSWSDGGILQDRYQCKESMIRNAIKKGMAYVVWELATAWHLILCVPIFITIYIVRKYDSRKIDIREPPVISSTIPVVGHLLGMLLEGSRYFKRLGRQNKYPIFTLPMPGSRLYIVTDPSLAANVQRAPKLLSFNPIIPPVLQRVAGFNEATVDLIKGDMEHGFVQQVQEQVHAKLGQGDYLDKVTLDACNEFLRHIQSVEEHETDLLKWIKHLVTISTATLFYGPNNPVQENPKLIDQFWDFDDGIPGLLVGIMPWLTARKAYKGREQVVQALKNYLTSPQFLEASTITKNRTAIARKFEVDDENTARSDLTFFFAGIINTSLTSFWMVLHIFAQPSLLAQIRAELESTLEEEKDNKNSTKSAVTMDIKKVIRQCKLLNAVFKEVLRLYSDNFATRVVLSNTMLANKYFLAKDSIVQISGGIIHADPEIWGPDAGEFNPGRFLSADPSTPDTYTTRSIHPAAFRAFGGGTTLCPGRHFALGEILGLVAMIVLTLDIDAGGEKQIGVPPKKDNVIPIHVLEPVGRVHVRMGRRRGWGVDELKLKIQQIYNEIYM